MSRRALAAAAALCVIAGLAPLAMPTAQADATPGVTASEVRVLVALEGRLNYTTGSDPSNRTTPGNQIYDLAQSEDECRNSYEFSAGAQGCSHLTVRALRGYQDLLNAEHSSSRALHLFVSFSNGVGATNERRRAEAAFHLAEVDPFAVVPLLDGAVDAYTTAIAQAGRMVFSASGLRLESALASLHPYLFDTRPSAEQQAGNLVSLACSQVVGRASVKAGAATGDVLRPLGGEARPRRLGLIRTSDIRDPQLLAAGQTVFDGVEACGGTWTEVVYNGGECCAARDNGETPALQDMLRMRNQGVETVVWAGGFDSAYTDAAKALGYQPEWLLMGDGMLDNPTTVFYGATAPDWHDRAVALSYLGEAGHDACISALSPHAPSLTSQELSYACDADWFESLSLAGAAIAAADPDVRATNVAATLAAGTVETLAGPCTAGSGHTCRGGAELQWFDALGTRTSSTIPTGCFRRIGGGITHQGDWPDAELFSGWSSDDPCSSYTASTRINLT